MISQWTTKYQALAAVKDYFYDAKYYTSSTQLNMLGIV